MSLSNKFFFITAAIFLSSYACKKVKNEDFGLPSATQEGKNTFGCKVNGTNWVAVTNDFKSSDAVNAIIRGDSLYIYTKRYTGSINQNIIIEVKNLSQKTQTITLNPNDPATFRDIDSGQLYVTDSNNTGTLIIDKLDTANHIIAGHFNFVAKDQNSNNTVHITEGRFDLKFHD